MQEVWKDIVGYENMYQISNLGRVKSLARACGTSAKKYTCVERILKPRNICGYNSVMLYQNGKTKQFKCSRLVAQAFIPNPDNLPIVNHKDENKRNDCIDNLEWCTIKYNTNYGNAIDKIRKSRLGTHASAKTREKMSVARTGVKNPMYGRTHSEETRLIISQKIKQAWKEGKYSGTK